MRINSSPEKYNSHRLPSMTQHSLHHLVESRSRRLFVAQQTRVCTCHSSDPRCPSCAANQRNSHCKSFRSCSVRMSRTHVTRPHEQAWRVRVDWIADCVTDPHHMVFSIDPRLKNGTWNGCLYSPGMRPAGCALFVCLSRPRPRPRTSLCPVFAHDEYTIFMLNQPVERGPLALTCDQVGLLPILELILAMWATININSVSTAQAAQPIRSAVGGESTDSSIRSSPQWMHLDTMQRSTLNFT